MCGGVGALQGECVCVYLDFGETFKDPCDCLKPNSLFTQTILSQATLESSYFT